MKLKLGSLEMEPPCCLMDSGRGMYITLGAEYPSPKKVNLSIMVGLHKPKKVKGYLVSYQVTVDLYLLPHRLGPPHLHPGLGLQTGHHPSCRPAGACRLFCFLSLGV